jgi:hypothetical protein
MPQSCSNIAKHIYFNEDLIKQPQPLSPLIPPEFTKLIRQDIVSTILTTTDPDKLEIKQKITIPMTNVKLHFCHIFALPTDTDVYKAQSHITSMSSYQPIAYRTLGPIMPPTVPGYPAIIHGQDKLGRYEIHVIQPPPDPSHEIGSKEAICPSLTTSTFEINELWEPIPPRSNYIYGPSNTKRTLYSHRPSDRKETLPHSLSYTDTRFYSTAQYYNPHVNQASQHNFDFPPMSPSVVLKANSTELPFAIPTEAVSFGPEFSAPEPATARDLNIPGIWIPPTAPSAKTLRAPPKARIRPVPIIMVPAVRPTN